MKLARSFLFAAAALACAPLHAEDAALPKIPVVKTWGELRDAKPVVDEKLGVWKLRTTGEAGPDAPAHLKIRLGIARAESPYNDAAVVYCLVEAAEPVGDFQDGPEALGPLTIRVEGPVEEAKAEVLAAHVDRLAPKDSGSSVRLYVQTVPLLKPGTHRIVVSAPPAGRHPAPDIAEATVEVSKISAPVWLPWGDTRRQYYDTLTPAQVQTVGIPTLAALPSAGSPALPIATGGMDFPEEVPDDGANSLPELIPTKATLATMPLGDGLAVKLSKKTFLTPATEFFLLRWWLNGREQTATSSAPPKAKFQDAAAAAPSDLAWFVIDSPPPEAREGDTVSLQVLFCPRGIQALSAQAMLHLQQAGDAWPGLSEISPVADYALRNGRLVPKDQPLAGPAFAAITDLAVPDGAEVTLHTDRKEYFLGENVLVDFVLTNKGTSFAIDVGGDYRGSSRTLRFKVAATDAKGEPMEDPDPFPMCMGGRSHSPSVKPDEKWIESLALMRYRKFEKAGTYTIRASHDFGWIETTRPRPAGETKITFVMPNAEQAERIVEEMRRLPDDPNRSSGEASVPYADFTCLRYPVYLAPLSRLAWAGDLRALQGLGAMETPEATEELVKLLDHPNATLALEAALTLNFRLPDPEWDGQLNRRGPFMDGRTEQRKRLVKLAWDVRFAPAVRSHANLLLASTDPKSVAAGGFMLQAVGLPEDLPPLLEKLDRLLATMQNRSGPEGNVLYSSSGRELLRAATVLTRRGDLRTKPTTPARELAWLEALPAKAPDRPAGWEDVFLPRLSSTAPLVREKAVTILPSPLPPPFRPGLISAFSDADVAVQRAACDWMSMNKQAEFLPQVLEVLKTARHEWLFHSAANAAAWQGGRLAAARAIVERLDDKSQATGSLGRLADLVVADYRGGGSPDDKRPSGELRAIKAAWQAFLDKHGDDIDAGKKFPIGSTELSPALFGKALQLGFPDGTKWPPPPPPAE